MKVELIFTLVLLCAVLPIKGQVQEAKCMDKGLVNPEDGSWVGHLIDSDKYADYIDQIHDIGHTVAYNDVHSCYTLQPGTYEEGGVTKRYLTCCYLEYKFKLLSNSDKYTSRCCIPIKTEEINGADFDDVVNNMKTKISKAMGVGTVLDEDIDDLSIVCSKSSFLKVSALLLLAFLL